MASGHGAGHAEAPLGGESHGTRASAGPWPRVGVAVIVVRDGRVLLGRRIGATHGADTWQFPGGHLEAFESVEACAAREVREETGLAVRVRARGPYTNDVFDRDGKHYVTLFVVAEDEAIDAPPAPMVREPHKCAEWRWCDWDAMPSPRFLPIEHLLAGGYRPVGVPRASEPA